MIARPWLQSSPASNSASALQYCHCEPVHRLAWQSVLLQIEYLLGYLFYYPRPTTPLGSFSLRKSKMHCRIRDIITGLFLFAWPDTAPGFAVNPRKMQSVSDDFSRRGGATERARRHIPRIWLRASGARDDEGRWAGFRSYLPHRFPQYNLSFTAKGGRLLIAPTMWAVV